MFGVELGFPVEFTMNVEKKAYGLNDVPMGLSTSPLYRLGAVRYKRRSGFTWVVTRKEVG